MPLLTPEQFQEIRQIVEDHHDAFVVNAVGPEAVSTKVLNRLRDQGLVDVQVESVKDAYVYGQLLAMMQSSEVANMSYEQFKQHVRRNPIPLSEAETHALRMAQQNAGQYCKGLGNRVNVATGDVIFEADAALRSRTEGIIRDATALNIARRETVQKLKSDLGWATKDWARDWDRIAVTEKQTAMQRGVADHYRGRYGGNVLVAKRSMPDACFRAGTPILTQCGEVPIEQVQVGDQVLTHKMRWRRVTHLFRRHFSGKLYGLNGRKPVATGNHPYLADLNWRRLDSLQRGEYVVEAVVSGVAQDNPSLRLKQRGFVQVPPYGASTGIMPISAVQLYRYLQARNSDIDVEWANGHFGDGRQLLESVAQSQAFWSSRTTSLLPSEGFLFLRFWCERLFAGFSGIVGKLLSFFFGHTLQPSPLAIGLGWKRYAPFQKAAFYGASGNSEVFGQRFHRVFPGFPEGEQLSFEDGFPMVHGGMITPQARSVNSIATEHFNGTVYNLEVEDDESYVAGGLVVHNCRHCKRVFLGPDGQPRIFKLSDLEENGTNVGRKANDYLPLVGTIHPNCQCQLIRVPAGWGFNEEGQMVPGGELGERYETPEDLAMAMLQENDLQKAFKLQGHLDFQGLPIAIENRKGTVRKWKAANGESGETKMAVGYGYIQRTNGIDEDEVDVFVGPDPRAEMVYIVEQQIPETGLYDETKCMIGFPNQKQAEQTYKEHYDRPGFMLYTTALEMDQFKRWLQETAPKKGEMMAKGETETIPPFRLVVPFQKARVPAHIGAATSQAGNQSPSPGTSANYIMMDIPPRPEPQSLKDVGYRPDSRELMEHFYEGLDAENPLKVDKEIYHMQNVVRIVRPIEVPERWKEAAKEAREGTEDRMRYVITEPIRNVGRPKNTAEIDTEIYGMPEEAFQKGVTPIGGITPGGYRRVAKDKYIPVSKKKKPKREPVEKKPRRTWIWHKPGLPKTTAKRYKNQADGTYDPKRKPVQDKIVRGFLKGKNPPPAGQQKVAIVLMGGPASGKISMVKQMLGEKFGTYVNINPDDVKEQMPEYNEALEFDVDDKKVSAKDASPMCHEESSDIACAVYEKAVSQGLSMIVDGTGARGERHRNRIQALKDAGYHVQLMMPDLNPDLAAQRAKDRAEETGRWVPTGPPPPGTPDIVRKIYSKVPQNFEPLARLADEFALFDTTTFPPTVKWTGGQGQADVVHDSDFLAHFKERTAELAAQFGSPLAMPEEILSLSRGNPPAVSLAEAVAIIEAGAQGLDRRPKRFDRHTGVLQIIDDVDYTQAGPIRYREPNEMS